jgi:hypothetical protein
VIICPEPCLAVYASGGSGSLERGPNHQAVLVAEWLAFSFA